MGADDPRAVRRLVHRRADLRAHLRGARARRLGGRLGGVGLQLAGRELDPALRQRGAEGALAAGDRGAATASRSACLTEPGGGTDLGNMQTTATRVPRRLAPRRHQGLHLARRARGPLLRGRDARPREEAQRRDRVPRRSEARRGITIGDVPDAHAASATTSPRCTSRTPSCPTTRCSASRAAAFRCSARALDMGRFSVAARCVGQAQRCIDLAMPYAREREAFGQQHRRVPADPAEDRGHDLPHAGARAASSTSSAA